MVAVGSLAFGLCALVVDRALLSPEDGAGAGDPYTVDASSKEGEFEPVALADPGRTENSIRERLRRVSGPLEAGVCADAFMKPARWRDLGSPVDRGLQTPSSTFEQDYSLSTVMTSGGDGGYVTLVRRGLNASGRFTIKKGETVDGHTLVSIHDRSAVFRDGAGDLITLTLAEPDTGRARQGNGAKSDLD